ncbi:unnamed protein product [Prunus armeniaca]
MSGQLGTQRFFWLLGFARLAKECSNYVPVSSLQVRLTDLSFFLNPRDLARSNKLMRLNLKVQIAFNAVVPPLPSLLLHDV